VWRAWTCLPIATALTAVSVAAAPAPDTSLPRLRVIVRVTSPADSAFVARLRGQTSDLPVEIVEAPSGVLEPTPDARIAAAAALAAGKTGAVVLWRGPDQVMAYIEAQPAARLLARSTSTEDTGPDAGTPPDAAAAAVAAPPASADLEAAALISRAALKAIIEGQPVGEPRPPPPPPARLPPPAPPPVLAPAPHAFGVFAAAAVGVTADGVASDPTAALSARAGGRLGRFAAGLTVATALPKDIPRGVPNTRFVRRSVEVLIAADIAVARWARLTAELQGGVEWFRLDEPVNPNPNATRRNLAGRRWMGGAELRAGLPLGTFRVGSHRGAVDLTLGVGSDLLPHPPTIFFQQTPLWKLSRLEPRGILGAEVTFR
jgi:hypothetical protein